jgi:hypothetical protein
MYSYITMVQNLTMLPGVFEVRYGCSFALDHLTLVEKYV